MSNDPFERDVRAVLAGLAPAEVPASLAARVAGLEPAVRDGRLRRLAGPRAQRTTWLERFGPFALAAVAGVLVLAIGGLALFYAAGAPGNAGSGVGGPKAIVWQTNLASLEADAITIETAGQVFSAATDRYRLSSDPGSAAYRTLEVSWMENGVEMRLNIYFEADESHWWVSELRVYDGRPRGEWITFRGPLFRTEQGANFSGDIELSGRNDRGPGQLRIEGARLTAFLPGTGPRPFEDCRFIGPAERDQDAGANDEDPFAGPLARLGVEPGMAARAAHRQLVQAGVCHDFRYSWWTEPPREGGRRGFSQRWCIPPPGVLSADAAYGGQGEIVFFIWSDHVRGWDPLTPSAIGCN